MSLSIITPLLSKYIIYSLFNLFSYHLSKNNSNKKTIPKTLNPLSEIKITSTQDLPKLLRQWHNFLFDKLVNKEVKQESMYIRRIIEKYKSMSLENNPQHESASAFLSSNIASRNCSFVRHHHKMATAKARTQSLRACLHYSLEHWKYNVVYALV